MELRKPTKKEFENVMMAANRMSLDTENAVVANFVCVYNGLELAGFGRIKSVGECNELATLGVVKRFRQKGVSEKLITHFKKMTSKIHLLTVIPEYFEKRGFKCESNIPFSMIEKFENKALWHGYGNPVVMSWRVKM
jgi:N-acetylglutamate synthase-like GNAT family acetyltransferase